MVGNRRCEIDMSIWLVEDLWRRLPKAWLVHSKAMPAVGAVADPASTCSSAALRAIAAAQNDADAEVLGG